MLSFVCVGLERIGVIEMKGFGCIAAIENGIQESKLARIRQ